ncbi:MAG TPA: hypothetical protein VG649_02020 [Candidatus Angelobacter sp.]|nr:hypothetical protein [Candidatus Angelobacter sp.]
MSAKSGVLSAVTVILLMAIAIVVIAPEVDLEDGVLGAEQILYALLMALASIVALTVVRSRGAMIVPAPFFAFCALASPSPSVASCCLLC